MHRSKDEARVAVIDKTITAIIERALARGASDIHIEPRSQNIVVRFRLDGWLQEVTKLPLIALHDIIQNIKSRSGLDTSQLHAPQSGTFNFDSDQVKTSIQVATMPTVNGEKVAMRLTRQLSEPATLGALGFWGKTLANLEASIAEPHGLVIAASLHRTGANMSMLGVVHLLNNPSLNIATLEDPIEHQVPGVNQTQVNSAAGVTFNAGLKALLHQDPNVVMVSDLHEDDTVQTAIQAALSGRLLIGGIHASDAAHGVVHLLNMHVEPFMIATALRLAIGQRFVRRLCPSCAEPYTPDEASKNDLRILLKSCGVTNVKMLHELEHSAIQHEISAAIADHDVNTTEKTVNRLYRANHEGCPRCNFSGYNGRLGICEVLKSTDRMKRLVASNSTTDEIRTLASQEGMVPLALDGLVKALRGLTTLEEILPLGMVA